MNVKEKWKGFGKKTVSILLCASLVLPFGQGVAPDVRAAAGEKSPVCFQASRLPADSLPEGNCIYFGTAAATVKERGEYEVRVYREGDFDSAASVEVRTLDMSAVYGEDYELVMEDVEQSGDGKTLLEKYVKGQVSADDGNKLPDAASQSTAGRSEGKSASEVSALAAKKEAQTGVESRELHEIEEKSFVESMSDVLVGDTMENIDASSKCTITFDAGEKSKTVRFRIREDEKSEGTEGFSLLLANAEGAEIFQVTTCAISIEDDEKAEHSKISFSQPEYRAADGKAVLTVKRTGAEYSICDMTVRTCGDTAQAGTNYEEKNETLAFAPYETEKKIEMDVAGSGRFQVMLDDLKACEEGEIVKAAVEIAENGGKTPRSYVKFYGLCAMNRKFNVSLEAANALSYRTGTKDSSVSAEPVQVSVECGAQVWNGDMGSRDIYANRDESQSNLVFSVGDTYVNGRSGKFGKITGYKITLDPGNVEQKVTKNYPQDFISWMKSKNGAGFRTEEVNKEIEKVTNYLDTIPYDSYFLQWISEIQQGVREEGYGYKQVLKFKPVIDYNDVKVEVLNPKGAAGGHFSDEELKAGREYTFHAGDSLDLSGVAAEEGYDCVGYQVSTDGKRFNTIMDGSDLFLESFQKYWIRPLVMKSDNKVEIRFADDDAASRFEIAGLIDQSLLEANDKGKNILNLQPGKGPVAEKMKPVPNKDYVLNIRAKDGMGEDDSYVYRPTVKFQTANTTYTTQYFPFTAAAEAEDNIIVIGVSKVLKSSLRQYTVKGTLVSAYPPIRSDGLAVKKLPVSSYTLSVGKGGQTEDNNGTPLIDTACTTPGKNGVYEMSGITGVSGDVIPMLMTDGASFGQIADVKLDDTYEAAAGGIHGQQRQYGDSLPP